MTKSWEQFSLETGLLACMLADIENISFASVVEVSAYVDMYIRLDPMLFLFDIVVVQLRAEATSNILVGRGILI
jgi:hypothetical protein